MIVLALFMLVYSWLLNRLVWIRLYIVIIYREQEPPRLFSLLSFGTLFRSPVLSGVSGKYGRGRFITANRLPRDELGRTRENG
jgi:hypothetical protein